MTDANDARPAVVFVDLLRRAAAGDGTSYDAACETCGGRVTTWRLVCGFAGRDYFECDGCGAVRGGRAAGTR